MRAYIACYVLASSAIVAPSCSTVTCGEGTIERAGHCEAADTTTSGAMCGPFTMLEGTKCVPQFDPTICDPGTTAPEIDPATGVTTCKGTGGGGCGASLACPAPIDASHQTICGQLFDLETGNKFQGANPTGAVCMGNETTGPCSLRMDTYDAYAFGTDPATAQKLQSDPFYLDDCGRYRITNIKTPTGPFIGLGLDDRDVALMGPSGNTNSVGWATPTVGGTTTKDLDGYIAKKSTTDAWTSSGGPALSTGILTAIFFANKTGAALQSGVQFTKNTATIPANTTYFTASGTTRTTVDATATSTGANGTALVTGASVSDKLAFSGIGGGLDSTCTWAIHAGASLPNIVFVQEFRPVNALGMTCTR